MYTYQLSLKTGDDKDADTSAPIWFTIFGNDRKVMTTGRILLIFDDDTETFARNQTRHFTLQAPAVHKIAGFEVSDLYHKNTLVNKCRSALIVIRLRTVGI